MFIFDNLATLFKGITSLGRGSKREDQIKTGQYGVGFNSVYHLTDTPTFLASVDGKEKVLCAFDPRCSNVYGATRTDPGRKFQVEEQMKNFPDVFKPYLMDQFRTGAEGGVLFRLPLRSSDQASEREMQISGRSVSHQDVTRLLLQFMKEEAGDCLLFLKNVKNISASKVDPDTGKLVRLGSAKAHHQGCGNNDSLVDFHQYSQEMTRSLHGRDNRAKLSIQSVQPKRVEYNLRTVVEFEKEKPIDLIWTIVQQYGFAKCNALSEHLLSDINNGNIGLSPCGAVAYCQADRSSRKVFCLLPLKMVSKERFHVNAHFALNYESRDALVPKETSFTRYEWNEQVLSQIVAPCVVALMESVVKKVPASAKKGAMTRNIDNFLDLLPKSSNVMLPGLFQGVCKTIYSQSAAVFPIMKQNTDPDACQNNEDMSCSVKWVPVASACFVDMADAKLTNTLKWCGMPLVSTEHGMQKVLKCFETDKLELKKLSPATTINFFGSTELDAKLLSVASFEPLIADTPFLNESNLCCVVKYMMEDYIQLTEKEKEAIPPFIDGLKGLPIILSERGNLQVLNKHKLYMSKHSALVPSSSDQFLHHNLINLFSQLDKCANTFKKFTIPNLASMLDKELNAIVYKQCVDVSCVLNENGIQFVRVQGDNGIPKKYLQDLWAFLEDEMAAEKTSKSGKNAPRVKTPQELLAPLHEWSLLPCEIKSQLCLAPIGKAHLVFDIGTALHMELELRGLPLRYVRQGFLEFRPRKFFMSAISKIVGMDAHSLIDALIEILPHDEHCICNMRKELLNFFQRSIHNDVHNLNLLVDLPLFERHDKTIGSAGAGRVFVMPPNIPIPGFESNNVILTHPSEYQDLFKKLGFKFLTFETAYTKVILPLFSKMSVTQQMEHLKWLAQHIEYHSTDVAQFVNVLKGHKLFNHAHELVTADELYDGSIPLFKTFKGDKLIESCYTNDHPLSKFLVLLGLHHNVGQHEVLEFAQEMALFAGSEETLESLLKEAFADHNIKAGECEEYLEKLGKIQFLPPYTTELEKQLVACIPGLKVRFSEKVCFSGSMLQHHHDLAWSQLPCINFPFYTISSYEQGQKICKELKIKMELIKEEVWEHVKYMAEMVPHCGEVVGNKKKTLVMYAENVALILKYLGSQEDCEDLDVENEVFLPISEKTVLVAPKSVVLWESVSHDLFPHLVSIDSLAEPVKERKSDLKKMGANTQITLDAINNILLSFDDGEDISDSEEEKSLVNACYASLLTCLQRKDEFEEEPDAIMLPSIDWIMMPLQRLVLVDNKELKAKIMNVDDLHILLHCKDSNVDNQLACLKNLSEELQPKTINEIYKMQPEYEEEVPKGNELSQLLASHFGDDRNAI